MVLWKLNCRGGNSFWKLVFDRETFDPAAFVVSGTAPLPPLSTPSCQCRRQATVTVELVAALPPVGTAVAFLLLGPRLPGLHLELAVERHIAGGDSATERLLRAAVLPLGVIPRCLRIG